MLAPGPMVLHHEPATLARRALRGPAGRGLAGLGEIALAAIGLEFRIPLGHQLTKT